MKNIEERDFILNEIKIIMEKKEKDMLWYIK